MSKPYPTPHIKAVPEDFARTVLMPGDPLRAKFIAETFLDNPVLVNNVRGVNGYTGTFEGARVSVMASGMGMPSIGIYSYELYNFFGVENIIRIGSAGALDPAIHIREVVFGMGACTNSNFANQFHLPGTYAPICSYDLLKTAVEQAKELGVTYHVGNLLSSDPFYGDDSGLPDALNGNLCWAKMGVMAVEMEAAALYMNAARANKPGAPRRALALCTISDHIITGEVTTAEERQNTFTDMMKIALRTAKEFDHE
ncbi:MAG: purine-nucleoside phosphorylase [Lachnospiraceae bacterium]|nr:purine-nucleoside phosphorylase [Lachnospiraceae bacterium]MBQ9563436.1 purine-nucleoside phosphorylase [Lachnospiraceae bacterium]MBQ9592280.1 purine-nucleoside phosphorylase [Lachnospiraceae bacterium]MBR0152555.1 purine-nucleoside phosphorylase [Lachnospiraceae bacterium]